MSRTRILVSADEDYLGAAIAALTETFFDAEVTPLGPDIASFVADGVAIADLAAACQERHIAFVRHLAREVGRIALDAAGTVEQVATAATATWRDLPLAGSIALHVWASGPLPVPWRTDELWRAVASELENHGITVHRGGQEQVLSLCVTAEGIIVGMNSTANALSDWPGGRVKLAKPKGQVSRSEFKLEELFRTVDLGIPDHGVAIDLGASPGGWTRILRQRGLSVWAVDPASLDPRIARDPDVQHVRTTAGPFLATTELEADLVVNDMRMTPDLSATVMLAAARCLMPGGAMIQTLKLTPHAPVSTVRDALAILAPAYEVVYARQLFHNRNEVTVVARRRGTT